jgi:hypothetical protein
MSPTSRRTNESILVRQNNNGTYSAIWTPASTGQYQISLSVDGYTFPEVRGMFMLRTRNMELIPVEPQLLFLQCTIYLLEITPEPRASSFTEGIKIQ